MSPEGTIVPGELKSTFLQFYKRVDQNVLVDRKVRYKYFIFSESDLVFKQ